MEIVINWWAVLACAALSMVIGATWYGPLFGRAWMKVIGADALDMEKRKQMQKEAGPLYLIQFVLSILQVYILAHFVKAWGEASGVETAVFLWLGFVVPTVAAASMWNNDPNPVKRARFGIQAGYYLVSFIVFGFILSRWG